MMEILEDDLILVTSTAILYAQLTGDNAAVAALIRISVAMVYGEREGITVKFNDGRIDPNTLARMKMAEALMEIVENG